MKPRGGSLGIALMATVMAVAVTACGTPHDGKADGGATPKQVKMDEQQAIKRAEEIIHQAVDGMSPKPTLKHLGRDAVGPCLARDDHGPDGRVQVRVAYQLTDVPGQAAKTLVRQARDAWVKQGHTFQSSDEDWSKPFPAVYMRTESDDFWMDAITGAVDREKGDGLASVSVTSPCFQPGNSGESSDIGKSGASSSAAHMHQAASDRAQTAERRVLDHSSRIYDALQAPHAPLREGEGEGLRAVDDADGPSLHHTWSTAPLDEGETVRTMRRAQEHFESAGWRVRHLKTGAGAPALIALNAEDHSVAQVAPSATGHIRVAVTTPADEAGQSEAVTGIEPA
ncbi:hypothetical protein ACFU99_03620 [Streptomyces sp. NPDC057654]|uniref:hypothetical protein n=1 Tax=Streptomyces sp. NPDC057654 TaxID=3346196 RepID=UPI0036CDAF9E